MKTIVRVLLSGLLMASVALAKDAESHRALLREGLSAFDDAIASNRDDESAHENYARSAAAFEALVADGVRNPAIYYNLGNAYYRLGDVGRSVLNYRRAERLDPGDAGITSNLRLARQRVTPLIKPTEEAQIWRQLFFWHFSTSRSARLWAGIMLSSLGWALLLLAVWMRRRAWGIVAGIVVLHGLGAGLSVAWDLRSESQTPPAVIVHGEPILRLGRGEGQDAALSDPLGPGIELAVLSERAGWLEVALVDGQMGWLPADGVEFVKQ